jgi:histidine triad (HIT) family protein
LTQLQHATPADKPLLGHLMWVAAEVAKKEGLQEGFRIVINDGPNGMRHRRQVVLTTTRVIVC